MATLSKLEEGVGAVQRAKAMLRELVAGGELVPGQRLVESELGERFGMSRLSLREAFSALEAEGLLRIERYKGASVRRLDPDDIVEAFEVRELLEGLAARRAASQFQSEPFRARLIKLVATMEEVVTSARGLEAFTPLNRDFHQLILEAACSERLKAMEQHISPPLLLRLVHRRLALVDAVPRAMTEHRAVFEALLDGNGRRAEAAMRRHIRNSMHALAQVMRTGEWAGR